MSVNLRNKFWAVEQGLSNKRVQDGSAGTMLRQRLAGDESFFRSILVQLSLVEIRIQLSFHAQTSSGFSKY
jgi:hypothetical protein